jgi:hypothetical protein
LTPFPKIETAKGRVRFNGNDVFVRTGNELPFRLVDVPLNSGRNVLVLSIQENLPSRVAEDTDHFELTVP